jgi:predicted ATP-grasp superfamily ATP-dependent carboligase
MALYGRHFAPRALQDAGPGVVALHLRASLDAELPPAGQLARGGFVHGFEIVYAPRRLRLDEGAAQGLSALAGCHDLPAAASRFDRADPLCSVSASGVDAESLRALLGTRRDAVHALLEKTP